MVVRPPENRLSTPLRLSTFDSRLSTFDFRFPRATDGIRTRDFLDHNQVL